MKEYNFKAGELVSFYTKIDSIKDKYSNKSRGIKEQGYKEEVEKKYVAELSENKRKEIANVLVESSYTSEQKLYLYSKLYKNDNIKMVQELNIDADAYIKLDCELFSSDKDTNGKTIKNSKVNKIASYVNNLPDLSIPEKAILIKSKYSNYDKYNKQIIQYIDKLDLTISEKEDMLKNLGFKIRNGRVYE